MRHTGPGQLRRAAAEARRGRGEPDLVAVAVPAVVEGELILAPAFFELARVRGELEVHGLVRAELDLALVERAEACARRAKPIKQAATVDAAGWEERARQNTLTPASSDIAPPRCGL